MANKKPTADEAISPKINTLPFDFWNYIEPKKEEFLKYANKIGYQLLSNPTSEKTDNLVLEKMIFGIEQAFDIKELQQFLKKTNKSELRIDCRNEYNIYALSITHSETGLCITQQRVEQLIVTQNDFKYEKYWERHRDLYALNFYSAYIRDFDTSRHKYMGGVSATVGDEKRSYPYTFGMEQTVLKKSTLLFWFVLQLHDYLKTILDIYLYKDVSREYFKHSLDDFMESDFDMANEKDMYNGKLKMQSYFFYENRISNIITIQDLFLYRTKNEWVHGHTLKTQLKKLKDNFNKYSLEICMALSKGISYFKMDDVNKLYTFIKNSPNLYMKSESAFCGWCINKALAGKILVSTYYKNKLLNKDDISSDEYKQNSIIIDDYADMLMTAKKPDVSLNFKSMNRINKEHDKLSSEMVIYDYVSDINQITVTKRSQFNELRKILPNNFEWIKDGKRLYEEGKKQHNCVLSYCYRVIDDSSAIYHATINNREYTIEFCSRKKNEYFIAQMYLACNALPYNEDFVYVCKLLGYTTAKQISNMAKVMV